mgnify:CR=1
MSVAEVAWREYQEWSQMLEDAWVTGWRRDQCQLMIRKCWKRWVLANG